MFLNTTLWFPGPLATLFVLLSLSALTGACDIKSQSESSSYGTFQLPLTAAGPAGTAYRLSQATLHMEGPTSATLNLDKIGGDLTVFEARVAVGAYAISLADGWILERESQGEFKPVEAQLISSNPLEVIIKADALTTAHFTFETASEDVSFMAGDLEISWSVQTQSCEEGALNERSCGQDLTGREHRVCQGGAWSPWSPCQTEGETPEDAFSHSSQGASGLAGAGGGLTFIGGAPAALAGVQALCTSDADCDDGDLCTVDLCDHQKALPGNLGCHFSGKTKVVSVMDAEGFSSTGAGAAGWNASSSAPEPEALGHSLDFVCPAGFAPNAYQYLGSAGYTASDTDAGVGFSPTNNVTGFPHLRTAAAKHFQELRHFRISFGVMSMGGDVQGVDWSYSPATQEETRRYTGGTYNISYAGVVLFTGTMPEVTLTVGYPLGCHPSVHTIDAESAFFHLQRAPGLTGTVAEMADGWEQDLKGGKMRFSMSSSQDAIKQNFQHNGRFGGSFDLTNATIEAEKLACEP